MKCDAEQTRAVVHRALDEGITLFDTADAYGNRGGSEELLGMALGNRWREVIVASKFGMSMGDGPYLHGASRRYVMAAAEDSLRRLNTDYIDLYQLHFPDPETPQEETLGRSPTWFIRARSVTSDAATSPPGSWLRRWGSRAPAGSRPTSRRKPIQSARTPDRARTDSRLPPLWRRYPAVFSAGERLPDRQVPARRRAAQGHQDGAAGEGCDADADRAEFRFARELEQFARERGHTLLELAVGWLVSEPQNSSVICGATSPEQVSENVKAGAWKLSAEERDAVDKLTQR
jgi:aryl-alcohol dehydrogenase-like predicted oxidoreductase